MIYQQRNELLETHATSRTTLNAMRRRLVDDMVTSTSRPRAWRSNGMSPGLEKALAAELSCTCRSRSGSRTKRIWTRSALRARIVDAAARAYEAKVAPVDREAMRQYERAIMLQSLDTHWREHLAALDHLRQGIHLRGYAQKNPKQEYKREAFELFSGHARQIKTRSRASS